MNRIKVNSSNIHSVGYDKEEKILEIQFSSGGIYFYKNVEFEVYMNFLRAGSKGQFFNDKIKENFPFEKGEFKKIEKKISIAPVTPVKLQDTEKQEEESQSQAGRHSVMTPEIITEVIARLQRGFTIREVCEDVGIAESTFYNYQKENVVFMERVRASRSFFKMLSSDIVLDILQDPIRVKYDEVTGKVIKYGRYSPKVRADMAKFILEKQSEAYSNKPPVQVNTQNNFFGSMDDFKAEVIRRAKEKEEAKKAKAKQQLEVQEGQVV